MKIAHLQTTLRLLMIAGVISGVVLFFRYVAHVNPTTVALSFLLCTLVVSAYWGLRFAVALAIFATLAFNLFFLPPIGKLTIADPQNWVALFAFLATAIIASQLSDRARREAANANQRRQDVERLYAFSQRLLATDNLLELLNTIPSHVCEVFAARSAAIYLAGSRKTYRSDARTEEFSTEDLRTISTRGEPVIERERGRWLTPLRLGARVTGALGVAGSSMSRETLEALGGLIAIAIERANAIEKLGKAEAARESENLRTALLDSVTHELRTPLTGIKAAVTSLLSDLHLDESQRKDMLTVINEETDRLNHLVGEAAEMAQLDAHVELRLEPVATTSLIHEAVEQSRAVLGHHPVEVRVTDPEPRVKMDKERIVEVLKQLLENAAKYSPPEAPVVITAEPQGNQLVISVADRGPGIEDFEQPLIFDKFYRGRDQRYQVQGTGMGLPIARAIVEAHGGAIGLTSQLKHGSVFYFKLPAI